MRPISSTLPDCTCGLSLWKNATEKFPKGDRALEWWHCQVCGRTALSMEKIITLFLVFSLYNDLATLGKNWAERVALMTIDDLEKRMEEISEETGKRRNPEELSAINLPSKVPSYVAMYFQIPGKICEHQQWVPIGHKTIPRLKVPNTTIALVKRSYLLQIEHV